mmetsp:Transcript_147367/g.473551  ORF Transcript_147367/g.473551 Transcript_147367/m.473551 type:complete len:222 (-) Transcript_147367:96-761(-)
MCSRPKAWAKSTSISSAASFHHISPSSVVAPAPLLGGPRDLEANPVLVLGALVRDWMRTEATALEEEAMLDMHRHQRARQHHRTTTTGMALRSTHHRRHPRRRLRDDGIRSMARWEACPAWVQLAQPVAAARTWGLLMRSPSFISGHGGDQAMSMAQLHRHTVSAFSKGSTVAAALCLRMARSCTGRLRTYIGTTICQCRSAVGSTGAKGVRGQISHLLVP